MGRHKIWIALPALLLVIGLGIGLSSLGGGGKPSRASSRSSGSTAPKVARYSDVESLLAAMAVKGAVCTGVSFVSHGTVPGSINPYAECSGSSNGDTSMSLFTSHAAALDYAKTQLGVGKSLNSATAEVVGPNWVGNTVPSFAAKVQRAVGGQIESWTPGSSASSASPAAPAPAPSPNGTYTGSGDYTLSPTLYGDNYLIGEVDVTNTGNVGIIARVKFTWPQEGYPPIVAHKTVRIRYGATKVVRFHVNVGNVSNSNVIDLLQSWQSGHGYANGYHWTATIIGTYGATH